MILSKLLDYIFFESLVIITITIFISLKLRNSLINSYRFVSSMFLAKFAYQLYLFNFLKFIWARFTIHLTQTLMILFSQFHQLQSTAQPNYLPSQPDDPVQPTPLPSLTRPQFNFSSKTKLTQSLLFCLLNSLCQERRITELHSAFQRHA